jgi:putative heme-binding domain-containing protein
LLSSQQPASVREAVIDALGDHEQLEAAEMLIDGLSTFPPVGRRRALELLTSRTAWAGHLLAAVSDGSLSPDQVSVRDRELLLRHRDKSIVQMATATLGAQSNRAVVVDQLTPLLSSKGDPARGKLAFEKVCASCHRLEQIGTQVGPDLQPLRNRGAQFMLVNILDPNREVDSRYEAYTVLTANGKTHTGILLLDSDSAVELLQADGKPVTINKIDMDEFQASGRSLMPEGLEQELKPQGIADVIAFLLQSPTAGKEPSTP